MTSSTALPNTRSVLIVDGGRDYGHSHGKWNSSLSAKSKEFFVGVGWQVLESRPIDGYDKEEEVQKLVTADLVIFHYPVWWMMVPAHLKTWIDEVFSATGGILFGSDGRTRQNPDAHYGSGGFAHGKKYMLAPTWNAPERAFTQPGDFFDGKGVDASQIAVHKMWEFIGYTPLSTFASYDTMKNPDYNRFETAFMQHLKHQITDVPAGTARLPKQRLDERNEEARKKAGEKEATNTTKGVYRRRGFVTLLPYSAAVLFGYLALRYS